MFEADLQSASLVLGIDTSSFEGSLALARVIRDHPAALLLQKLLTGRRYADELIPHLKQFLINAELSVGDLSAIVVVSGPGSFTGLRVGIAAAKALAEACNLPVIAVSRLALLAGPAEDKAAAILDAGRGAYFLRMPAVEFGIASESLEDAAALILKAAGLPIHICEPALKEALHALAPILVPAPTAFDAIRYAQSSFFAGDFADVATLDANYVRRPYADPAQAAGTPAS